MKSNYKKLGQYIRQVNIRNTELEINRLLGVSIKKVLMPSIANTVGTNMKTYKIIQKGQFAYGAVTSRNGDKISIALLEEYDEAIVSQAYTVFEVKDKSQLSPEYLMMWFRRPEFDRYARFKSHGSARETFDWEEMLDTELPVPSIERQREIVAEYNTVVDRIKLNEELNKKLEETAQTLYKHWFVDFEFPDENGNPYKTSGGEMVYNAELDKDIPVEWEVKSYEDVLNITTGKLNSNAAIVDGTFPFFTCSSETFKTNTYSFDCEALLLAGNNASAIYPFKYYKGKFDAYQRTYVITPSHSRLSIYQAYFEILGQLEGFKGVSSGTATKFLTMKILNPITILIANKNTANYYNDLNYSIFQRKLLIEKSLHWLGILHDLLLSRMTRV
jgi:type I restriction enzyme S subunit